MNTFDAPVWRVSWSVTGNMLAVSSGDGEVTLWKQNIDGKFENTGMLYYEISWHLKVSCICSFGVF